MGVAETKDLVGRLAVEVGMILEDTSPLAVSRLPRTIEEIEARLIDLARACEDAHVLAQAARVLARRGMG